MKNLDQLEEQANHVLFRCQTVFPFTFFPNTIEVTETRVDIHYGIFFFSTVYRPVLLKDILNVRVSTNLLFGKIDFELTNYEQNPEPVGWLWKSDAIRLKNIITGILDAVKQDVDLSKIQSDDLETLESIGKSEIAGDPG